METVPCCLPGGRFVYGGPVRGSSGLVNNVNTGGQYPNAFMGVGFSNYDLARYGDDGIFLDLTPYLTENIMPNLYAILEEHPEIRAAITQEDGKIYSLPTGSR